MILYFNFSVEKVSAVYTTIFSCTWLSLSPQSTAQIFGLPEGLKTLTSLVETLDTK